ncbi:hypothetical protein C5167_026876 [Papaver somniferum]|nr:hypothetical protein C5167_026876 [Papaver somniferum]
MAKKDGASYLGWGEGGPPNQDEKRKPVGSCLERDYIKQLFKGEVQSSWEDENLARLCACWHGSAGKQFLRFYIDEFKSLNARSRAILMQKLNRSGTTSRLVTLISTSINRSLVPAGEVWPLGSAGKQFLRFYNDTRLLSMGSVHRGKAAGTEGATKFVCNAEKALELIC